MKRTLTILLLTGLAIAASLVSAGAAEPTTGPSDAVLDTESLARRLYISRSLDRVVKNSRDDDQSLDDTGTFNTGTFKGYSDFPAMVDADLLHQQGLTGAGVTIAVLDTGLNAWPQITKNTAKRNRLLAHYDAIDDRILSKSSYSDKSGHGTHVISVAVDPSADEITGRYNGVAPDVSLVAVRAFDGNGRGTYADVIRGIEWAIEHKELYGIRVLNLSFSAPVRSHYWEDPVNQAVMRAWEAGIVVVVSAGNGGPEPMTVGVPGNVPYVITVGAMTDSYTPDDPSDDRLTSFSATGPTAEAFVKPDVIAPGGHIVAMMDFFAQIAKDHPEFHDGGQYFQMSGTSQAAAVVSGVVALLLQAEPTLTPDDVKCRMMAAAHPALSSDGTLAYSVFQQGAGMVNAYDAVFNTALLGCANHGMDIAKDLAGTEHYAGHARRNADGEYYVEGLEESSLLWNESTLWQESVLWSESSLWQESMLWNESLLWNESTLWQESFLWNESMLWNESVLWSESDLSSSSIAINLWVDQE